MPAHWYLGKESVMLAKSLKEFLDGQHIPYTTISHKPSYTAQEIAAAAHIPGKNLAKTVMVKLDGKMAMAVLPAPSHINFRLLKQGTGASQIALASEDEFKGLFPDTEVGAMPPFGNLYGLDVYIAESLAEDEEIAFNGGTHSDLIKMTYETLDGIVHPKVLKF